MRVPVTPLTLLGLVVMLAQPAQITPTHASATETVHPCALITAAHYGAKMGFGLAEMDRRLAVLLYVVAMAAVIVGVDFVFFRNRFWERLIVNIGIVLVFG